jgi:prevent-host-death family protein
MEYPIGVAKSEFSRLLREAREAPVVITRRGEPEVVLLAYDDYKRLRRLQGYQQMIRVSNQLGDSGVTVQDLQEASREELEDRRSSYN